MQHSTRVAHALARLPEVDPAIAALALWCTYRDSVEPTATQGDTILVGPEFPLLAISEQTGLIAHHVLHVALRHSARRSAAHERYGVGFRADQYDLACDALVNEALLQGGHAIPRPAVRAGDLVQMLPPSDRPENVLSDWDCDRLYVAIAAQSKGPGGEKDGAVERYAKARGFAPDLKGGDPDGTQPEIWSGRIEQAMRAGQMAGTGIGAIVSRFGDLPKAMVPWEIKLRRLLNKALAQHPRQSHRRPARAWLARDSMARETGGHQPVFEPGLTRDQPRARLVICLDTSSSIATQVLDMFAAEAIAVVRRTGAEAYLLGFDTEVHTKAQFDRAQALASLAMRRGGGTDFGPVLEDAQSYDPSMIVMLTDLDAELTFKPTAAVLWAVPAMPSTKPEFGKVLVLDDNPEQVQPNN
ncbi:MAG: VWA-like domain-containing protein [Pseudomonadota bacterium]